tara:strand:+ start:1131 stop:1763 length:633 start_codon:yes stop_codon:yes gene_type:complete
MRCLDLFSGTHSVGNIAANMGFDVVSLDLDNATICLDIMEWDYTTYKSGYFDVVWCSPPCDTFSCARFKNIGRYGITRETIEEDIQIRGLPLLRKTEEIINYFKPTYYFIENPATGSMKKFIDLPCYTVDYCMYGFCCRKRTNIWTNLKGFEPKLCNKQCGSFIDGKHMCNAVGGNKSQKGQGGGNNKKDRYRIPKQLINELFQCCQSCF